MAWYHWSKTAASNATADASIGWAEGQAPSSVNDSARAMMARTAEYRDDIAGAIVTGGTSTAYTLTSNSVFTSLAFMANQMIAFTPHTANGATVTLNVDSLGAKPLRPSTGVELQSNVLIAGTPYMATYNNSDAVWYLHGLGGNTYGVPLLSGFDFWGTTAPSSCFIFPTGQELSRTTYATAFAIMGTSYGVGNGSTTFNVPDKTGRVSAMKEAVATRLTTAAVGVDGATMGAAGGGSQTLVTGNLPAYTPAGSVALTNGTLVVRDPGGLTTITHSVSTPTAQVIGLSGGVATLTAAFTGTAQGGTSTPVKIAQPTIVCNYIIRII